MQTVAVVMHTVSVLMHKLDIAMHTVAAVMHKVSAVVNILMKQEMRKPQMKRNDFKIKTDKAFKCSFVNCKFHYIVYSN